MSAQVAYLGTSTADWVGELSSSDPLQRRLGAYALVLLSQKVAF